MHMTDLNWQTDYKINNLVHVWRHIWYQIIILPSLVYRIKLGFLEYRIKLGRNTWAYMVISDDNNCLDWIDDRLIRNLTEGSKDNVLRKQNKKTKQTNRKKENKQTNKIDEIFNRITYSAHQFFTNWFSLFIFPFLSRLNWVQ